MWFWLDTRRLAFSSSSIISWIFLTKSRFLKKVEIRNFWSKLFLERNLLFIYLATRIWGHRSRKWNLIGKCFLNLKIRKFREQLSSFCKSKFVDSWDDLLSKCARSQQVIRLKNCKFKFWQKKLTFFYFYYQHSTSVMSCCIIKELLWYF